MALGSCRALGVGVTTTGVGGDYALSPSPPHPTPPPRPAPHPLHPQHPYSLVVYYSSTETTLLLALSSPPPSFLYLVAVLNCYGEGFPDLPASLCAGSPLNSQLGLWGPFSLINHACW